MTSRRGVEKRLDDLEADRSEGKVVLGSDAVPWDVPTAFTVEWMADVRARMGEVPDGALPLAEFRERWKESAWKAADAEGVSE